ncbi:MAG TPA: hypothetical protein VK911_04370, partial [Vicinamibacterales bacterium]|nr:hypothetical protein [Vicinamibacterales bacterium]
RQGAGVIRAAYEVERTWSWEGPSRYVLVVLRPRAGAHLTVRFPRSISGRMIAADSGEVLRDVGPAGTGAWDLPIPAGHDVVLVLGATAGTAGGSSGSGIR